MPGPPGCTSRGGPDPRSCQATTRPSGVFSDGIAEPTGQAVLAHRHRRLDLAAERVAAVLAGVRLVRPATEKRLGNLRPGEAPPRERPVVVLAGAPVAPGLVALEARLRRVEALRDVDRLLHRVA